MHVPERSLLAVQNLPLNFVSFLVHSRGETEEQKRSGRADSDPARNRARGGGLRGVQIEPTLLVLLLA